jgi:phosphatidylinositol-3-phosphatase
MSLSRLSLAILTLLCSAFGALAQTPVAAKAKHVFVIVMENTDSTRIYGNVRDAPYINTVLLPRASRSLNFVDELSLATSSEPHYVMMEAGKVKFADWTASGNADPSARHSTASTAHLTTQLAAKSLSWMAYQEGMSTTTGLCPIVSSKRYAAKHNPFVFFQDITGKPPSKSNRKCGAHMRNYTALKTDLAAGNIANYVFITPDLCNDMHDRCGGASAINNGDTWLKSAVPPIYSWAKAHNGVIFIVWDEGSATAKLPFLALGKGIKKNYASTRTLSHRSMLKAVETYFGLPIMPTVKTANDFSDLFVAP